MFSDRLTKSTVIAEFIHFALPKGRSRKEVLERYWQTAPAWLENEGLLQKYKMESEWMPALLKLLEIDAESLPVLWDANFLHGPKTRAGDDTPMLCELNVSAVYPFPDEYRTNKRPFPQAHQVSLGHQTAVNPRFEAVSAVIRLAEPGETPHFSAIFRRFPPSA